MITHLFVKTTKWTGYISGHMLLYILEQKMVGAPSEDPNQAGDNAERAYLLDPMTPSEWLGVVRAQQAGGAGEYWMKLGGRLLHIDATLYVSDRGVAEGRTRVVKDAFNDGIAPSYREIARRLKADGVDGAVKSGAFATDMRALFGNTDGGTRQTRENILPVLMGAMFVAEPRRNEKALPINLMLLDFAEAMKAYGREGNKVFTWEKILWHPEALELDSGAPNPGPLARTLVGKPQHGPLLGGGFGAINTIGGLHRVGGKMPASPTGGGAGGNAIAGGLAGLNYIHQKEASILLRWLAYRNAGWQAVNGVPVGAAVPVIGYHVNPYQYNKGATKEVFDKIKRDLDARISSWDALLT